GARLARTAGPPWESLWPRLHGAASGGNHRKDNGGGRKPIRSSPWRPEEPARGSLLRRDTPENRAAPAGGPGKKRPPDRPLLCSGNAFALGSYAIQNIT